MQKTKMVVINGQVYVSDLTQAKISVFDRGFLYGDAVYEVARSYDRVFFELDAHMARMFNSAAMIDMNLGFTEADFIRQIYEAYSHLNDPSMYMRIQITRGEGPIGLSTNNALKPNVIMYFRELETLSLETHVKGVSIVTTERLRNNKNALDPNIKSGNYLNNILAFRDATRANAIESVMVNSEGFLTEGTTSNIFCIKNGKVLTPPDDFDLLKGITRAVIQKLCVRMGIEFLPTKITPRDLESADEVFITSSTREVVAVTTVNSKSISPKCGRVTQELSQAYKEYVRNYCENFKKNHSEMIASRMSGVAANRV